MKKPYSACLLYLVGMVRQYLASSNSQDDVYYTIEAGANGRKQAEDFLRRLDTNPALKEQYRLRGYTFVHKHSPDGDLVSAADLLIWEWQRNYRGAEKAEETNVLPPQWSLPFRQLVGTDASPPIYHAHLGPRPLQVLAIQIAVNRLDRD